MAQKKYAALGEQLDWAVSVGILREHSNERPGRDRIFHLYFAHGLALHLTAKEAHLWVSGAMAGWANRDTTAFIEKAKEGVLR